MIDFKYPEGATPIDPDEAEGFLLTHITTHGELNRWEQDNIVEAMAWIDKTNQRIFLMSSSSSSCTRECLVMSGDGQGNSVGLIRTSVL